MKFEKCFTLPYLPHSVTQSPVAQKRCPARGRKRRMTTPRCREAPYAPAELSTVLLPPTARHLVASWSKGPISFPLLRLSGAWRKSASSSPHFKVSSQIAVCLWLFEHIPVVCADPSRWLPAGFRLRGAGGAVSVAGNRWTSSAAAPRRPPNLNHEH